MAVKSLEFLVFVFIILCLYYLLQKTDWQKYILLAANIVCVVSMASISSAIVILLLSLTVFGIALKIEESIKENGGKIPRTAKYWFWCGAVLDIGILIYFKFFKNTWIIVQKILSSGNITIGGLIVPIGLAYYSLALYGYLSDIYHKKYEAEKKYLLFLTYVTYFPAIIEGPVNFYKKVMPQLKQRHFFNENKVVMGIQRSVWGYFKKLVVADRIGILVMGILQDENAVGPVVVYALILYSFQIYADFSGGIDVIMGISEMLDISLTENFRSPLVSTSVTEYWQRWHISLGEFMEKYIYYPIVLNRNVMKFSKKIPGKYISRAFSAAFASVVVFIIVGIWHGTGWNYVVYGMYQAFFVSTAVLLAPVYKKLKTRLHINEKTFSWKFFTVLRTFVILLFGRTLIKAGSLQQTGLLLQRMFSDFNPHALFDGTVYNYGLDIKNVYLMYGCILLMIVVDILHEKGIHFRQTLMKQGIIFRYIIYYAAIFGIIIFGIYGPEFDSASFIYQVF